MTGNPTNQAFNQSPGIMLPAPSQTCNGSKNPPQIPSDIRKVIVGARVARIFRFIDILGCELHRINDPEEKLPIPEIGQVVSIGSSRMRVVSITLDSTASSTSDVYNLRVRLVPPMSD